MNTSVMRFVFTAAMAVFFSVGCNSVLDDRTVRGDDSSEIAGSTDEAVQAVTGCEVDCSNGSKLLCTATPCQVIDLTTLSCQGIVTQCPPTICVPRTCADIDAQCGSLNDGCGHTLNCGACPVGRACRANECGCPASLQECLDGTCKHICPR